MTANDNGFHPSRHQPGNVLADNSFPEDSATEDVSNCPIGRLPHLLQLELLHSLLIRSYGCTLYANVVFLYGFSSFHSYFIICSITMLNAQVIAVTNTQRWSELPRTFVHVHQERNQTPYGPVSVVLALCHNWSHLSSSANAAGVEENISSYTGTSAAGRRLAKGQFQFMAEAFCQHGT